MPDRRTARATAAAHDRAPLLRLWAYAAGHRARVVLATVMSVLNTAADLAPPFLIGVAVDVVTRQGGSVVSAWTGVTDLRSQLYVVAAGTVAVWVFESLTDYAADVLWRNLAQTIEHEARVETYEHVQSLDLAAFEDRSTGGLLSVLNDDVNQLERFLDRGAHEILHVVTSVLLIGGAFVYLSPAIGLVSFLPMPVIVWGTWRFQRHLEPRYAAVRARVGDLNATLNNNLGGIATIKAFGAERREAARVAEGSDRYQRANRHAIRLSAAFVPVIRMAILAAFTAIIVVGGIQTLDGRLEVGEYSVMVLVVQRLLWPLTRIGETLDLYQRAMASVRRLLDLLAEQPTLRSGSTHLPSPRGHLRFEGVRFAYPSAPDLEVLHGIDIDVPAGQTHAVVGATGAGKSTIVKLLLRFYDVTGGRVTIDGHDVRELDTADLRGATALVAQDVFLFHGTVRDNLVYGQPDADAADVEEAARAAEAHGFILALPQGYDTLVGERGQKLSGGQRQRLSIARAVLRDPAVLLLDEATSAVDNETEAAIQRSLARISEHRTSLVIAHRLSTIRHADRIHVLAEGEVVESGTHDELVAHEGTYAALWRVQTGELEPEPR
ncbi:MAG: ABC transporter ATP-binding protein [Nitriliruptor sp.]|uniref:ABC transporter ATP-binding protein n=1 Tax=Nitriliruptor sp. TaxID=2448056 RepID=UPI0034A0815B